ARRSSTRRESSILFSSRRRHTRFKCDWSSDVCSSDLITHTHTHTHTYTHKNTHTHKHTHSPDQIHHIPQQWRLGERSSEKCQDGLCMPSNLKQNRSMCVSANQGPHWHPTMWES